MLSGTCHGWGVCRLRTYRALGCARGEAPLGLTELAEPTIEYDLHAMLHFDEEI
jgi:hypothetical protein